MSRVTRWDFTVPCPRMIAGTERSEGSPDVDYEAECEGTVRLNGYFDPGTGSGGSPDNAYDAEGSEEADACDTCGFDDWTSEQVHQMTEEGRR